MAEQFYAGYQLEPVERTLRRVEGAVDWPNALYRLCAFEVDGLPRGHRNAAPSSLFAVADNLIARGWPTRMSCALEDAFVQRLGYIEPDTSPSVLRTGALRYRWQADHTMPTRRLVDALTVVDPRIKPTPNHLVEHYDTWEDHDSNAEVQFHTDVIPRVMGPHAFQLLQPQRPMRSILQLERHEAKKLDRWLRDYRDQFYAQRVDFALELPSGDGDDWELPRWIMEVDGHQHHEEAQRKLDQARDRVTARRGWTTARIPTDALSHASDAETFGRLRRWADHPYLRRMAACYDEPLWATEKGQDALQLVLSPLAIARVQRVLTQLVLRGTLDPEAERWHLVVLERDVPCARLAIDDWTRLMGHLTALQGREAVLPDIDLTVYGAAEMQDARLRETPVEPLSAWSTAAMEDADVVLDVSVLQRAGYAVPPHVEGERVVRIRTAHAPTATPRISTAPPLEYPPPEEDQPEALVYLLQMIFRKEAFREGQVEILRRALARESVIALLPTGAGKSLAYQLAALLQPGVTLVVDPIKSLMRDQHINLRGSGIDVTTYINSELSGNEKRERLDDMAQGAYLFAFVSPERLMIERFRNRLHDMAERGHWFSYCVVDEAHCVSEWGHDFRTTYLRLGANARSHLATGRGDDIPMLALTGTASYDVLEDVRRDLQLDDAGDEAIITPDTYQRDELNFSVWAVKTGGLSADLRTTPDANEAHKRLLERVGEAKQEALVELLAALPQRFGQGASTFYATDGAEANAGIIFTPHRKWVFGAKDIKEVVTQERADLRQRTGYYYGSTSAGSAEDEYFIRVQDAFKQDEVTLLAATKAFGTGIDKPNIRYTIHFNMPQSIESFYQEAGRAGRDRQNAHCVVLYCDDALLRQDGEEEPVTVDKDLMLSFHRQAFRGKAHEMRMLNDVLAREAMGEMSIEQALDQMAPGERRATTIRFDNGRIEELSRYLSEVTEGPRWTVGMIAGARRYAHAMDEFIDSLVREASKRRWTQRFSTLVDTLRGLAQDERFVHLVRTVRSQEDTFKSIYRLTVVGAVTDFTLDYRAEQVHATFCKHTDHEYLDHLQQYLARYMAPEDVQRVPDEVLAKGEPTLLRACLSRLIDFVYRRIKRKRRVAIDNMERAVEDGQIPPAWFEIDKPTIAEKRQQAERQFAERVYTFFESRYTPDLRVHLRDTYNTDLIAQYVDETQGAEIELRHLRGACERLLEDSPDHVALLGLRAYAELLLDDGSVARAQQDLRRAHAVLVESGAYTHEEALGVIETLLRRVEDYDGRTVEHLPRMVAPIHEAWLRSFADTHLTLERP